jgi:2-oxoglutarate ferredoxin oxidoreductase subunit beta
MNLEVQENKEIDKFTSKDLVSDQEIRWCPGCGDYSILKQVQTVIPALGVDKKDIVFISGIGCSSRFPYYMNTFGMHSIHGRATAIATGVKLSNPKLQVWIVTGDGDSLSIGGNHFIHLLRRNPNVNVLLFNNQIYGLTKGQYSPTSVEGQVTKSSPYGVVDHAFNPLALSLGADATFVARTLDRDPKHMQFVLTEGANHVGTSMMEIYQNCPIFNDGAFFVYTDKETKSQTALFLEEGKPLTFGINHNYGVKLNGLVPEIIDLNSSTKSIDDCWIHNSYDYTKASILTRFFDNNIDSEAQLPRPFGIFYRKDRPCYEDLVLNQIEEIKSEKGIGDLQSLLNGGQTWKI